MPKKRYTPEEIIQHLRTVELDTGKGLAVLDSCRKLGITEQNARSASQRGTVLHAERSPDHHRTLEDSLQHGPSTQQSRGPATRSRNYPASELRTNMVGGTKTPGWSLLECHKEALDSGRPLCGLQCSLVLVFCLETSPKLFTTLEVGLEPARNDRTMVVGFALGMEKNCRHKTSKKCSSTVAATTFGRR